MPEPIMTDTGAVKIGYLSRLQFTHPGVDGFGNVDIKYLQCVVSKLGDGPMRPAGVFGKWQAPYHDLGGKAMVELWPILRGLTPDQELEIAVRVADEQMNWSSWSVPLKVFLTRPKEEPQTPEGLMIINPFQPNQPEIPGDTNQPPR